MRGVGGFTRLQRKIVRSFFEKLIGFNCIAWPSDSLKDEEGPLC